MPACTGAAMSTCSTCRTAFETPPSPQPEPPSGEMTTLDDAIYRHVKMVVDKLNGNKLRAAEVLKHQPVHSLWEFWAIKKRKPRQSEEARPSELFFAVTASSLKLLRRTLEILRFTPTATEAPGYAHR